MIFRTEKEWGLVVTSEVLWWKYYAVIGRTKRGAESDRDVIFSVGTYFAVTSKTTKKWHNIYS